MAKYKVTALRNELRSAGASPEEAAQLAQLASHLSKLPARAGLPAATRISAARRRWIVPVLTALAGAAIGMLLVMTAQTSLPGSKLYPIKRTSERLAVSLQPDYRGTIMMRRAQEVQQLVNHHASSNLVLGTLAEYRTDASAYHNQRADYPLLEYCEGSLRRAEADATVTERQAIQNTLAGLEEG